MRLYHPVLALVVFSSLFIAACHPARMALPSEIDQSFDEWPVSERNYFLDESFAFGPYSVAEVHRSWTTKISWGAGMDQWMITDSHATQKYEFQISQHGSVEQGAKCATDVAWNQLDLENVLGKKSTFTWGLASDTSLVCSLMFKGLPSWSLIAQQRTDDRSLSGIMTNREAEILVNATRELSGDSWPLTEAAGYLFTLSGRLIGAVEVINDGRIWVRKSESKEIQQAVASGAAALLLYREIRK